MADNNVTSSVKPEETKREKFVRLAQKRTETAMGAIAMIGGLAAPNNYEYTEEDWKKIFAALEAEMTKLQGKVKNPTAKAETGFSL